MLVIQFPMVIFLIAVAKCSFCIASDTVIPSFSTSSSNIFKYPYAFFPYFFNEYDMYSINGYFIFLISLLFNLIPEN